MTVRSGIQRPVGVGLGDPARGPDAGQLREPLGEAAGVGVVLGEPGDRAVGAVGQRDEAGRGEHADLAHAAADQLARATGAGDERRRARRPRCRSGPRGPSRGRTSAVSAGAASSRGVTPSATTALKNRAPSTWSGTPRRRAIAATSRDVLDRQRAAAGVGVGVLEHDQRGRRLVEVVRVAERVLDLGRVHGAVGALGEAADRGPGDDRVPARLVHAGCGSWRRRSPRCRAAGGRAATRGCPSCRSRRTGPPPCPAGRRRAPRAR